MRLTLGRLGVCAAFYELNFNLGSYCGITPNRLLPAVSTTNAMTVEEIKNRINELEKRKDMAQFQRKITTQLLTAIEYDMEIDAIDRRLEALNYDLKKELRLSGNGR